VKIEGRAGNDYRGAGVGGTFCGDIGRRLLEYRSIMRRFCQHRDCIFKSIRDQSHKFEELAWIFGESEGI
jgi:hypothetical protein